MSAACLLLLAWAPVAQAVPVPDPSINAPTGLRATYDAATDTVRLAWSTPQGFEEPEVQYHVYVDGHLEMTIPDPFATVPAPDLVSLIQVATATASGQSLPSEPVLVGRGDDLVGLLEIGGDTLCEPIILGVNPNPPYVFHVDWECIWIMLDL